MLVSMLGFVAWLAFVKVPIHGDDEVLVAAINNAILIASFFVVVIAVTMSAACVFVIHEGLNTYSISAHGDIIQINSDSRSSSSSSSGGQGLDDNSTNILITTLDSDSDGPIDNRVLNSHRPQSLFTPTNNVKF